MKVNDTDFIYHNDNIGLRDNGNTICVKKYNRIPIMIESIEL